MVQYIVRHIPYFWRGYWIKYTYLDCIAHDRLAVLDNEAEVRVIESEQQGLRANAASDIDNQRALRELFPFIPCQFNIPRSDGDVRKLRSRIEPARMASVGDMFFTPFMPAPNRVRRSLLSGASNQVHISSSILYALLRAALFDS